MTMYSDGYEYESPFGDDRADEWKKEKPEPAKRRPRDVQRARFWRAYSELVMGQDYEPVAWKSIRDVERYVDRLTRSAWFVKRFRDRPARVWRVGKYRTPGMPWSWLRWSEASGERWLLYQVAWFLYFREYGHGREFARAFLDLVQHKLGRKAAKALRLAYRKHKVRHRPKRIGRKPPEQTTEQWTRSRRALAEINNRRASKWIDALLSQSGTATGTKDDG